jgi:hypothetical protein
LDQVFKEYLDSDGIFVPEGSENVSVGSIHHLFQSYSLPTVSPPESSPSGQKDEEDEEDDAAVGRSFSFPDLDKRIRQVIKEYGAVFPKLNFSSPKVSTLHINPCSHQTVDRTHHGYYHRPRLSNAHLHQTSTSY